MQKSFALIVITLCTFYTEHVQAGYTRHIQKGFMGGNMLFRALEKDIRGGVGYESGVGNGFITGVYDSYNDIVFCPPKGVTKGQVDQIVYNYMQKHPGLWDKPALHSVLNALRETYSCK